MRLAGQIKAGFYPCPPAAVEMAAARLAAPAGRFALLDPCAGAGAAAARLGGLLGCRPEDTYMIELDGVRAGRCREALPGAKVLGPCSAFGATVSRGSVGLLWLNPPFDQRLEGGRAESDFLVTCGQWLAPGGVLAFVCPEHVPAEWAVRRQLGQDFECFTELPFPADCREYNEVIVLARKRREPKGYAAGDWDAAPQGHVYEIPAGPGPRRFEKHELTEEELVAALRKSPLNRHLKAPEAAPLASPPLALGTGHIALLLASGHLDGVVRPEGGRPHAVRGTARKVEYVSHVEESEDSKGRAKTVTTISQKIQLVVRVATEDGEIRTFGEVE